MIMFIYLLLSFMGYHFVYFSYCSYIFNSNKFPLNKGIVCGIINFIFWYVYVFHIDIVYEPLIFVLYAIILALETKFVFKVKLVHMLFISVTFCINLFAKRMVFLAIGALMEGGIKTETMVTVDNTAIVASISFLVSISTINSARSLVPRNSLDTILSDSKNISFLTAAFSLLYVMLFVNLMTICIETGDNALLYLYIILGSFSIFAFAVFIIFAHSLAELRISTDTYEKISKKNSEEKEVLKELEKEAITDDLTSLYTRDYVNITIDKLIAENKEVFIAFIDLDNLKVVNDSYGHDEGDFYIITVAKLINEYFREDVICRYGGDEIIVVGQYLNEQDITLKLIKCYAAVNAIPKMYKKEYQTSISYGVAYKQTYENISADELIAIADARMYELKKNKNKHRKVISPKTN